MNVSLIRGTKTEQSTWWPIQTMTQVELNVCSAFIDKTADL